MSDPTRGQIEAIVTLPTYDVEYNTGGGWVALSQSYVIDVDGANEERAGGENGITFGADAAASVTIRLDPLASSIAWDGTLVRVRYGFGASNKLIRFAGVIVRRSRRDDAELTWECEGWQELIKRTPMFSPLFYRRPAATRTTASSTEDPTNGAYVGGLVNYIFWQAGGRPLEQSGTYPSATFYYSCDYAPITPEWTWIAGENAWEELGRLAKACGMLIFQGADGVMYAKSALSLGGSSGGYTFTSAAFETIEEDTSRREKVAAVRCRYVVRRLQGEQVVYEDKEPRFIAAGASLTVTLEFQQPVYTVVLSAGALPASSYTATTLTAQPATVSNTVSSTAAGRIVIVFTNSGSAPAVLSSITIVGRPIAPAEEGIATVGSGTPEREIGDDTGVYVQSLAHAQRLAKLVLDFFGSALAKRTLTGCGYDPDRAIGEIVGLTYAPWSLSAAAHRIASIRHKNTGATMDVVLVPVAGLPTIAGVFVTGTTYAGADTRELSY